MLFRINNPFLRIKLLPLANGHGSPSGFFFHWGRYNFVTVSLLKRLGNGNLASETLNGHMDPEVVKKRWGS